MKLTELESKAKAAPKAGLVLSPDLLLRMCAALRETANHMNREARAEMEHAGGIPIESGNSFLARHGLELE